MSPGRLFMFEEELGVGHNPNIAGLVFWSMVLATDADGRTILMDWRFLDLDDAHEGDGDNPDVDGDLDDDSDWDWGRRDAAECMTWQCMCGCTEHCDTVHCALSTESSQPLSCSPRFLSIPLDVPMLLSLNAQFLMYPYYCHSSLQCTFVNINVPCPCNVHLCTLLAHLLSWTPKIEIHHCIGCYILNTLENFNIKPTLTMLTVVKHARVTVSYCFCHCVLFLSLSTGQYCVIVSSHWPNILVSLKFRASQRIRFEQIEWQCEQISSIFP